MEKLQITKNDSLSISDLTELRDQGSSVMRSAHIGNLSAYNMSLLASGIDMLLVDTNQTGKDKNYFPELVISQAGNERIADDGLLVARTRAKSGEFLDELQQASIRLAFPEAKIFTDTQYLRANQEVAGEIVQLALECQPELFNRVVTSDGVVTKSKEDRAKNLAGSGRILQLVDDTREEQEVALMPNEVVVLANFIIEAIKSEGAPQYHLAGPDMPNYIGSIQPAMQSIFQELRRRASFRDKIPAILDVQLVPTASAIFATTAENQSLLENMFESLEEYKVVLAGLRHQRANFFKAKSIDASNKKDFITSNDKERAEATERLLPDILGVPALLNGPGEPNFVSQYDVLQQGGLFVARQNIEMSLQELESTRKELGGLIGRAGP